MRYVCVLVLALAACGGGEEPVSAAECNAAREIIVTAAKAYEIENGEPPADTDAMIGLTRSKIAPGRTGSCLMAARSMAAPATKPSYRR